MDGALPAGCACATEDSTPTTTTRATRKRQPSAVCARLRSLFFDFKRSIPVDAITQPPQPLPLNHGHQQIESRSIVSTDGLNPARVLAFQARCAAALAEQDVA